MEMMQTIYSFYPYMLFPNSPFSPTDTEFFSGKQAPFSTFYADLCSFGPPAFFTARIFPIYRGCGTLPGARHNWPFFSQIFPMSKSALVYAHSGPAEGAGLLGGTNIGPSLGDDEQLALSGCYWRDCRRVISLFFFRRTTKWDRCSSVYLSGALWRPYVFLYMCVTWFAFPTPLFRCNSGMAFSFTIRYKWMDPLVM